MSKMKTVRLGAFREDPDNVSEATEDEIKRLADKLRRVPHGLTAMRIAFVTDAPGGGCMVISGNKRLRVLKQEYGDDGEVPADWFADVTSMSEAQRHEFRLTANISDGHFNLDKLLAQYDRPMLDDLGLEKLLADVAKPTDDADADDAGGAADEDLGYEEKYGVIVMCADEAQQEEVYNELHAQGYDVKVVAV